ncbi:MAG: T9SS type B sorting domain-containing protein, partial [Methylophagaceae bacterium]
SNNCKIINDSITVQQPDSIAISETLNSPTCNVADGSIIAAVTGGTIATDYVYNWDNLTTGALAVGINASLVGISPGTYQITVLDDSLCTNNKIITISNENAPIVEDSTVNITCNNDTDGEIYLTISGLSGTLYGVDWDIDGLIGTGDLDGPDNDTLTALSAGIYIAYVTDSTNGCITVHSDTVFDPGAILLTTSFDSVSCNGLLDGSASVAATGGNGNYTYLWGDGQTSDTALNLGVGNYTLTVTDIKGCFKDTTVTIEEPAVFSISSAGQDSVSCFGANDGSAFAAVSGGTAPFSSQWDLFSGTPPQTTDTALNLTASTYRVVITDFNGCKDSADITVLEPAALTIGSMDMDSVTCNGATDGTATANGITGGNGINSFSWNTTPIQTTNPATGLASGNYTVTVTDQKGCLATRDTTVLQPDLLVVDTTAQDSISCDGSSDGLAYVEVSGGTGTLTYQWDAAAANQTTDTASNLIAGTYTVTITDESNCSIDTNVIVLQPDLLMVDTTTQDSVSCSGTNDGLAYVAVSGGNGIFSYQWGASAGSQTTDTATNLAAGNYLVTITDQMLCFIDTSVTVFEPSPLVVDTTSQDSVLCNGSSDGAAYVGIIGGNGNYTYAWSDGQATDTASSLAAGTYQVTITDQLLCSIDTSVIVHQPDSFVVDTLSVTNPYCSSSNDASINLIISGGTSPYVFSWTDLSGTFISNNQDIDSLLAGTYYISVLDTNNCTAVDTITLTPGLEITANAGPDTLVCFGDSLTLMGVTSGATNPVISWNLLGSAVSSGTTISYSFDDSSTTIYDFVFVVAEQSCTVQDSIKVTVAPLPIVDAGTDAVIGFGDPFNLGGSPTGPLNSSYSWTPLTNFIFESDSVNENPEIEVNSSELYIVYVTDSNGCKNSDTIRVDLVPNIVVPSAFSPNSDGINDSWTIENLDQFTNTTVRVYNRWGSMVYDMDQVGGENWTGNGKNSKPIPVGTYYFIIEYDGFDGQKNNITGPITIIR